MDPTPAIITQPDRLQLLEDAILQGEPLNPELGRRLALLQAIDIVNVGAQYAEQAAQRQQTVDSLFYEHFTKPT